MNKINNILKRDRQDKTDKDFEPPIPRIPHKC